MMERRFIIDMIPFRLVEERDIFHAYSEIDGYEIIGGYGLTSEEAVLEATLFISKLQREMIRQRIITSRMPEEDFKNWVMKEVVKVRA